MSETAQVGHLAIIQRMLSNMAVLKTDSVSPDHVIGTEVLDH